MRTLSQWLPLRIYHRKRMLGQLLTPAAGRILCFVGAVSTTSLWFGGTSPTDKKGSNVAEPKYMITKLYSGGSGTRMETGKS